MRGLRLITTFFLIMALVLPTGVAIADDPPPPTLTQTVSISPSDETFIVGTSQSFTAKVEDGEGNPVQGADVTFTVSGANSKTDTVTTGEDGTASYEYTSTIVGDDIVDVSVSDGAATATSTIHWVQPNISLVPASVSNATGNNQEMTAKVTHPVSGLGVSGITVWFKVEGENGPRWQRCH